MLYLSMKLEFTLDKIHAFDLFKLFRHLILDIKLIPPPITQFLAGRVTIRVFIYFKIIFLCHDF